MIYVFALIIPWLIGALIAMRIWVHHFDEIDLSTVMLLIAGGPIAALAVFNANRQSPHYWRRVPGSSELKQVRK